MSHVVQQCGLCAGTNLQSVLSLGSSPPTCVMGLVGQRQATEAHHPLELLRCSACTLVQLSVIADPEVVFPPDYPYSSGNSKALHENFENLAELAGSYLHDGDLVVDIGANDGTLLSKFSGLVTTVGVEPTGQAQRISGHAYQEFFSEKLARRLRVKHGPAKVITACNVLAHVEDIGDVMLGVNALLATDGVLIAENHDLGSVIGGQWDTVYHEHLRFYSPHSFAKQLEQYGLSVTHWEKIPTHGGSFRMVATKDPTTVCETPAAVDYDFPALARSAADARHAIREAAADGLCGIGATARATTIINYCGLDVEDIEYVCEVHGSDKIGHYIPGTRIPVVDEARLLEEQPPAAMLFSWHLAKGIVPKLRERGYDGTIIVPLPTLQCL